MSDAVLRKLERRWKETRSVEDEAAWLRARTQIGDLRPDRLELAAQFGCPAASEALGRQVANAALPDLPSLLERPLQHGVEVHARAGLASLTVGLPLWESATAELLPGQVARDVEAWLLHPDARLETAIRASSEAMFACYFHDMHTWVAHGAGWLVTVVLGLDDKFLDFPSAGFAPDPEQEHGVRAAIQAELVPWLLGYSDPVRERVEARQRAEAAGE